jgi:hypothetical protein
MTDTVAEYIPEIVDQFAQIKPISAFDPNDLERMSPTRKTLFYAAHKALTESVEVEAAARDGDDQIRAAIISLGEKRLAIEALIAPWTPMDEYRRVVKKIEPPEPLPEVKAAAELARAEYDTAEADLMALQDRVKLCHDAIPAARKVAAQAWGRYHEMYKPPTPEALIRQHLKLSQQHRADGTDRSNAPARVILHPIDMPRDPRAPRLSSARGAYPPSMRHGVVAPPKNVPWSVKPLGSRG